jgi:hypothetical protein
LYDTEDFSSDDIVKELLDYCKWNYIKINNRKIVIL